MKYKLSEIMDLIGGGTPKTSNPDYWNGDIPWLSVKDFGNDFRYVYETEKSITELGLNNSSTKLLKKGDIIISARGTVGEIATIPYPMAFNQSCYGLRAKRDIVDEDYLYYLIKDSVRLLKKKTHGSVFDTITRDTFNGIEVDLPTLDIQKKIASILNRIDEKIEINSKINYNLQQQLFAIYKEFIGKSREMEIITLDKICDFQEGYVNPAQTHPEYFDGSVKWLRAVDINESFIINTSRTLTDKGFLSAKKSAILFKPNTIAISKSGTIGRLGIISDYMCGNRAVINIAPKESSNLPFIYCFLKLKQKEFPDMAVGSVQKNLYVSILESLEVKVPQKELDSFNQIGQFTLEQIQNNCYEISTLTDIRDTILPQLLSGKININEIVF